jgi:cyclase
MELIPSLDILGGAVVRLTHGDFATAKRYGDPEEILDRLRVENGARLHIVDLEGSRSGHPIETNVVRRLARRYLRIQIGGGIRSIDDALRWLDCGASAIVTGTAATTGLLEGLCEKAGAERVIPAVDVLDGTVRVKGWTENAPITLDDILAKIDRLGLREILVTDISKDGALRGPSFALYRELRNRMRGGIIASGGVTTVSDLVSLARHPNIGACVIGKALLEERIDLSEARQRIASPNAIPERVIPCLDVRDGRVVKGVSFESIRDAGDPVECAMRYEEEGADEIVILDISATDRGHATALDTVRRVADSIFIPLTVGGGIRSVEDFRAMLQAGADRVAINTAAMKRPELIRECANAFGVQAVVLSCDAKRNGDRWIATMRSGKELTDLDAVAWCRYAEELGAGEILLTSVDRDGTNAGFDIELLRAVTAAVKIGVIASGGAGTPQHFVDAIESGGARAVLAASLFHDRRLSIGDLKRHLEDQSIPTRSVTCPTS